MCQRSYGFLITKGLSFWLPNFGFFSHFSASLKIVRYIEILFNRGFVKQKEFIKKLSVKIQGIRYLVHYNLKFVISGVRYTEIELCLDKKQIISILFQKQNAISRGSLLIPISTVR